MYSREEVKTAYPNGLKDSPKLIVFNHSRYDVPRSEVEFTRRTAINVGAENQHDFEDKADLASRVLKLCESGIDIKTEVSETLIRKKSLPPIKIGRLERTTVNNIMDTNGNTTFHGIVWSIVFSNEDQVSNISDCITTMTIFKDDMDTGITLPLLWKISHDLPTTCNTSITRTNQNQYQRLLALDYIRELFKIAAHSITITKDTSAKVFLIFTFDISNSAYMIPHISITEESIISIPLHELNRYKFLIRFHSNQYTNSEGEMFRLMG